MKELLTLFLHLLVTIARVMRAGGARAIVAENLALKQRKYRLLYTPSTGKKPGPKGPSQDLNAAIVELKRRNPRFGCPRIAQQIANVFGIEIDKDVVKRVLAKHYHPGANDGGPSWLTFIGHM